MFNPVASIALRFFPPVEEAARRFSMVAQLAEVHEPAEIEPIISRLAREPGGGLIFPTDSFINTHRKLVIELAARYRLPALYSLRHYAASGGLVSYGIDTNDQYRQAAAYVDRILRGAKPADLPVQQPTKFEFVINLKTAKALGLDVPAQLLARADEVIE
jgi:putative ABC transport system substrate-binding protein